MEIKNNFVKENFNEFLDKIREISQIDDICKIKIENGKTLIYSTKTSVNNSTNEKTVLAMKSYEFETNYIFVEDFPDSTYDLVIMNTGKLIKRLELLDTDKTISAKFKCKKTDDVIHVRELSISSGKLKITVSGAELFKIRDLSINKLQKVLDVNNSYYSFKISKNDFLKIKKASSSNSDDKSINIEVTNNKVFLSEFGKWELEVDEIEYEQASLLFGKKYLSNINMDNEFINFHVFENFILVKNEKSNLMLSFEQTYEEDE